MATTHHRYQPKIVTQFSKKKKQMIEAEMVVIDTGKGILIPSIK